ncbi:MAG: hypothetical protein ACK5XN_39655 [Bacteroidota bacterium]
MMNSITVLRTVTVHFASKPGSPPLYDDDAWRWCIGSGGMDRMGMDMGRVRTGKGKGGYRHTGKMIMK